MFRRGQAQRNKNAEKTNTDGTLVARAKSEAANKRNWRLSTSPSQKVEQSKYSKKSGSVVSNTKSMYIMVVLPEKPRFYVEDLENKDDVLEMHEWWAENTVDFLNELQLMYGVLSTSNEEWQTITENAQRDETLGYPKGVTYRWKSSRDAKPKQLPVDSYIDHVFFWVNAQIENEELFPTDDEIPFPPSFKQCLKKMYQRMFRIFAIILSNECLANRKDVDNTLEPCFKHFLYFAWKWDLLDNKETRCVDKITTPIRAKFDRDHKMYLNHKLPLDD